MLHAREKLMPIEEQSRVWQLVLCSQHMSEDIDVPKMTAKNLKHQKDCHKEDGACAWVKYKNLITSQIPNTEKHHSEQLIEKIDNIYGQIILRNMSNSTDSRLAADPRTKLLERENHFRKLNVLRTLGQARDIQEQEFNRMSPRSGSSKWAVQFVLSYRLREARYSHQRKRARTKRLRSK